MSKRSATSQQTTSNKRLFTGTHRYNLRHKLDKQAYDLAIHRNLWSRIKADCMTIEYENGDTRIWSRMTVRWQGVVIEQEGVVWSVPEWGVHTNYPRNPFDNNDY